MSRTSPKGGIWAGGRVRRIAHEREILEVALALAADRGDPTPTLIQHVACTRAVANRVLCDATVSDERDSWLIAMQGTFTTRARTRDRATGNVSVEVREFPVFALVVDRATGASTDSGSSNDYPDLPAAGTVITDLVAAGS